ncbi:MAG TPA: choice-of-anchor Q domain-containing protein [Solirubrobacterales bacterium]|nr:choice-of-anchor Q domain-containing protein [Solirubrobacterales bacterium]
MSRPLRLLGLLVVILACLPAAAAGAVSYAVTNTADSGPGSLRAAIQASNDPAAPDAISISATGTIQLATALPAIADDVTVAGPGAGSLALERAGGAPPFRILQVNAGTVVSLSGLSIRDGLEASGAGILNLGSLTLVGVEVANNWADNEGSGLRLGTAGGILNTGSLTLRETFIHDNLATARGSGQALAAGGGIESEGALFVERSTISGNIAEAEGGEKAEAFGGGLVLVSGIVTIEESTISGNRVFANGGSVTNVSRGGGIQGSGVGITGSTITRNAAELGTSVSVGEVVGDNLAVSSGSVIRNSIVSRPVGEGDNCADLITSGGFNLDEDGSCEFNKPTDLEGVIDGLEPLADNGGPTPTHALREDSPVVDRGNSFGSGVDQRGLARPVDFPSISNTEGGDGSDIGAFELQAPTTPGAGDGPAVVTELPSDRTPPNTRIVRGPARFGFKRLAKFRFASTEAQSSFRCKLDKKKWKACANPFKRSVKPGRHLFKVRAIDRFGNVDPTPARFGWRVKLLS